MSPIQVLDPRLLLGVRQLKALLDARGVGYAGCVEKHELAELVENSGKIIYLQGRGVFSTTEEYCLAQTFVGSFLLTH